MFKRLIRPALSLVLAMSVLLGVIYPALITGLAGLLFPAKAQGSLIRVEGSVRGSRLVGQQFTDPKYFWGRPSATTPQPYNGLASGGSNLGPLNPALLAGVEVSLARLHAADPENARPVPVELVAASASGLDPDISPAAAEYQAARVARARRLPLAQVRALIQGQRRDPLAGLLGEPTINVLELNLALDQLRR